MITSKTSSAIAAELGERLKQARLNLDMTQQDLSDKSGISVKLVQGAEKGKVQLVTLIALLQGLDLAGQLELFLPQQPISPIQLAKLKGNQRQRASGSKQSGNEGDLTW